MQVGRPVRAAVLRRQRQPLVIEELLLAPPGPGEVEVSVAACGICHSDISYLSGAWAAVVPAVYGHEAAGLVTEVGEGVRALAEGQRVLVTLVRSCGECFFCDHDQPALCSTSFPLDRKSPLTTRAGEPVVHGFRTGAFAERIVVHASQVVPIPDEVPFACASLLSCGVLTGYGAVAKTSEIEEGASVVVVGAGGVGLNSVQAAALRGAAVIVAVDLDESKTQTALTFGATHARRSPGGGCARGSGGAHGWAWRRLRLRHRRARRPRWRAGWASCVVAATSSWSG